MRTIKPLIIVFFLGCFYSFDVLAQDLEEDESCVEPGKKVMKLIKEAEDTKNDKNTRLEAYTTAIDMAGDNAYVFYSFAKYNYETALLVQSQFDKGRANYQQLLQAYENAAKSYKKVVEYCSDYHSDMYYKLGLIYYIIDDKGQSAQYFKAFIEYDNTDPDRYSQEYSKNKADVEEILPEMEFYDKFFNNPVPFNPLEVKNVSSKKDEYLPMISPDNDLIFYTRKGQQNEPGGVVKRVLEEFTFSHRKNVSLAFSAGEALKRPFNTGQYANYGGVSMSLDNKEMFICACEEVNYQEHVNCDIYVSKYVRSGEGGYDYTWSPLVNLGPSINTKDGWEAQPTLSADGNTLYFATWRNGSDMTDIYYSTRNKAGKWSMAKPVPGINTEGHDKAPFLHQDSETMYFVSDCSVSRLGAGGSDIFYTRIGEDGEWTKPKNIGYPINTEGNEVGMVVSTDGHLAYFTSRNAGSNGYDIYYFELYEEARPQKVIMIKGEVMDESGDPVENATVEISYKESGENVEVKVNGDDGKFAAIVKVEENTDIMLTMKKDGYSFDTKLIKKDDLAEMDTYEAGVKMEIDEIKVDKAFTIDNILYNTASADLSSDAMFVLDQFIKFLIANPTVNVTIQGHTDNEGNNQTNMNLSVKRAKGVLDYIVSKGVKANRLKSEGYGETKPKVPNSTPVNKAKNRRTDFLITSM